MQYEPHQYLYNDDPFLSNNLNDVGGFNFEQNFDDAVIDDEFNMYPPNYNFYQPEIKNLESNFNPNIINLSETNDNSDINQYDSKNNKSKINQKQNLNKSNITTLNKENINQSNNIKKNKTQSQLFFPKDSSQIEYHLFPEYLFYNLKEEYLRHKGYDQTNSDEIFRFFLNYRVQEKKEITINKKIEPLMKYSNEDINYSIDYYSKIYLDNLQSQINRYSAKANIKKFQNNQLKKNQNINKPKFTKETMRRLYPNQTEIEQNEKNKMNIFDFSNFFIKLLDNYEKKNGNLSNDENELIDYWKSLTTLEKNKKGIQWENGINNLENELTLFLSDNEIINRLCLLFKKSTGTKTFDPVPLIEYWENQIKIRDKYYKGLYKYDKKTLYNIIQLRFNEENEEMENEIQKEEEELIRYEIEDRENRRLTKEEVEKLFKKYDELSKPKDKYKTGRVMLNLRNQFKYDNIIKKMIRWEFRDYREIEYPVKKEGKNKENEDKDRRK